MSSPFSVICRDSKRYQILADLESYKLLFERLKSKVDSLDYDLKQIIALKEEYRIWTVDYKIIILDQQVQALILKKEQLEKEMSQSFDDLVKMDKLEKQSIEVNKYETKKEIEEYFR